MIDKFVMNFCRHTEDSHVKTKLVHSLHQIQKYGEMPLTEFKDLLSEADYMKCLQKPKTWYCMTIDVFTSFIFRVRISEFIILLPSFMCKFK